MANSLRLFDGKIVRGFVWLLALSILFLNVVLPLLMRIREKREGRKALAAASPSELEKAVNLGCVLRFPDGSWLAIRYVDYHGVAAWSLAVARDSGGMCYESTEHFCGHLRSMDYYQSEEGRKKRTPEDRPQSRTDWMRLLAQSPDLSTARQRLTSQ